jgi:3-deoxy-7-phosphoheptulonate synthase
MDRNPLQDVNVVSKTLLPTPREVEKRMPMTPEAIASVASGRHTVAEILEGRDPRWFAVVGPCSIHDLTSAREYAQRLRELADEVADTLFLVMRVYFEKPRTSIGWKGFVNDPFLDDSFCIADGLLMARTLLLELAVMGLPAATETLDPITPQYLGSLITVSAIGARTTESQTHREMASGLSTPVGFKNGTDGDLATAVNALQAASRPHSFLGIDQQGQCAVFRTRGNRHGYLILRGGDQPNYDAATVARAESALDADGLPARIVVDCSHGNSRKDAQMQPEVLDDCVRQRLAGNRSIVGIMLESHLNAGSQPLGPDPSTLRYGVSITDACLDWDTTAQVLRDARERLRPSVEASR